LAAPIDITFVTSDDVGAGTNANFYMSILDSAGNSDTVALPKPLERGTPKLTQIPFVSVQDVEQISLRTFSVDGWKMETIEINLLGSTYTFNNQNGQTIDKYSGQVTFNPVI